MSCRAAPKSAWAAGLASTTRPAPSSTITGSAMVPITASRANGMTSRNRRFSIVHAAATPLTATISGVMLNGGSLMASNTNRPWRIHGAEIATIIAAARPR